MSPPCVQRRFVDEEFDLDLTYVRSLTPLFNFDQHDFSWTGCGDRDLIGTQKLTIHY